MGHKRSSRGLALLLVLSLLQTAAISPCAASAPVAPGLDSRPVAPSTTSVVLNEFVASNQHGLLDEDGDTSDWIEIYNSGTAAVNLAGWVLTDQSNDPWLFPTLSLPSNAFVVVFASAKNRSTPGAQLHTNFRLDAAGEYLGLLDSSGQPVSELSPQFPQQYADVSYGRYNSAGEYRYLAHPTPGALNDTASAYLGVVSDVGFSVPRGYYESGQFTVELQTSTPGATIRHTRTGSAPSSSVGAIYTGPVIIYDSMPLRAIAYQTGYLPSRVGANTYIMPSSVIEQPPDPDGFPLTWGMYNDLPVPADYEMDPTVVNDPRYQSTIINDLRSLPALVISASRDDLFGPSNGIYSNPLQDGDNWERPASVELINPDGSTAFQVDAGLRIHGGYTRRPDVTPKHSLRLHFRSDYGPPQLAYPLFPESPVSTFDVLVARATHNDSWLYGSRALYLRDQWIRDTEHAMGKASAHGTYVQLYIDGLYWGLYNLAERLDEHFAASYFGGPEEIYDVVQPRGLGMVTTSSGNLSAWNEMMAIANEGLASNAQYLAIQQFLDVSNLIDYMLVHIYAGTYGDWLVANWTGIRRREAGAGFQFFSWDNEFSLQYVDLDNTGIGPDVPNSPAYLYWKLRDNAEFRLLFADHVQHHFFNGGVFYVDPTYPQWDPAHPERNVPAARFMQRAQEIQAAVVTESARWGDWKLPGVTYNRDDHWIVARNRLLSDYLPQRSAIVLQQLRDAGLYPNLNAPTFNQHGGAVPPGFQLTMTAPNGVIYFTTDGSDPRVPVSGAISPTATHYTAPITLSGGLTQVKARVLSGATWSALSEAVFVESQDLTDLHVTEVMYNPIGGNGYEFLELKNSGSLTLNLTGVSFTRGIEFTFPPGFTLAAGQLAVLVNDPNAFARRYPGVAIAGSYVGQLANEGEQIRVEAPDNTAFLDVTFDDEAGWPTSPDGGGYSLVLANLAGDPNLPANWRPSTYPNGSPGADDPISFSGGVVVNEVLAHSDLPLEDAIELVNPSNQPIDISGWFLSDSPTTLQKFRIPNGTVIQPSGFAVFYEYQFNPSPGTPPSFALSSLGDQVFLAAATSSGTLTGYTTSISFGASPANASFGRFTTSTGVDFPLLGQHTFGVANPATVQQFRTGAGALNAYPATGPLVVDELMYHPPPGGDEFIELLNITDNPVSLFDPTHPANTWKLTRGVSFTFPINTVIPARSLALVVGVQPAAFRISYTVPITVPIFGPYADSLSNGGEHVTLARPDDPILGLIPYVAVDEIFYADAPPWPPEPDGSGPSLERLSGVTHGNDPATWRAAQPGGTPGRPNPTCYYADVQPNANHTQPNLCDRDVDIADIQRAAGCWNQPVGSAACPPTLNVNGQGAFIDVADIVAVAQRWGWRR